ncbi:LOW QUALITY PROTEIN: C2 domain-containing protein 5-like [Branchiostoma lanceolatum]|uniref:LOW QUALITY PROTEIN: C2 domain-containing protein 5-like n=1 Tax=Branchiostoma lanceolatum TaxID=7740 RepID=UPI003456406B
MPGKLKVRIVAGRDLPIMDRASDLTDAFVEVKFGATNYKTDVQKKSLNPQWNSDWFKFEVDDEDLQDEPLQIRVLDHDTYSAHDVIGKVYIDIDPLLSKDSASVMQGWFPIYDTMHGIRGSVYIVVKVDLFIDTNRFRQSSCGVQFFCSPSIPYGMYPVAILGFVEELVVNDDPEYQWIDKIRTPRASNEARQSLFSKLSGELQRKIGLKVLEMGGNAVIGYRQCFDLEGESGIVVRAIGTAAHLARIQPPPVSPHQSPPVIKDAVKEAPVPEEGTAPPPSPTKLFSSPLPKDVVPPIGPAERVRRQSSDSDLSTTPKALLMLYNVGPQSIYKCKAHEILDIFSKPTSDILSLALPSVCLMFLRLLIGVDLCLSITSFLSLPHLSFFFLDMFFFLCCLFSVVYHSALPSMCAYVCMCRCRIHVLTVHNTSSTVLHCKNLAVLIQNFFYDTLISFPIMSSSPSIHAVEDTESQVCTPPPKLALTIPPPPNDCALPPDVFVTAPSPPDAHTSSLNTVPLRRTPSPPAAVGRQYSQPVTQKERTRSSTPPLPAAHRRVSTYSYLSGSPPLVSARRKESLSSTFRLYRTESSESDLSTGGSVGSSGSSGGKATMIQKLMSQQPSLDVMEYPFFTLRSFQPGFLQSLGGVVSARSVKLLDRIHNPDEPETRDAWWIELRQEIRSHAHALGCNAVVGYSESTTICDELIVLSAAGTAALLNLRPEEAILNKDSSLRQSGLLTCSLDRRDFEGLQAAQKDTSAGSGYGPTLLERSFAVRRSLLHGQPGTSDEVAMSCSACHIPYDRLNTPFPITLENCAVCRHGKVPDVLFTTIEPPVDLPVTGHGCLIQARVCRGKRKLQGEANAAAVSDVLPFMEYELHRQLMHKLKAKSMNSLFGLNVEISVGETLIIGIATATAAFLSALPLPGPLKITGKNGSEQKVAAMQKRVQDMQAKNRDIYDLQHLSTEPPDHDVPKEEEEKDLPDVTDQMPSSPGCHSNHSHSSSGSDLSELDLSAGKKEAFVVEIDDAEDEDIISLMLDSPEPEGFQSCNTELPPGVQILTSNVQTFTTVMTYNDSQALAHGRYLTNIFDNILKTLYFKLRMMVPCCLSDVRFNVAIPEDNEMQVTVTAAAVGLQESPPSGGEAQPHVRRRQKDGKVQETSEKQDNDRFPESSESDREDMMFVMDGEPDSTPQSSTPTKLTPAQHIPGKTPPRSPAPPPSSLLHNTYQVRTPPSQSSTPTKLTPAQHIPGKDPTPSPAPPPSSLLHNTYQVRTPPSQSSTPTKLTPAQHIPGPRTYKQEGRSQLSPHGIQLSPLSYVPGGRVERYLGHVNMFFIRESTSVREHGGMNGVVHKFLLEVQAILRAHVSALGGNALLSHTVSQVVLLDSPHRNQLQCLLNVSGDAASVAHHG